MGMVAPALGATGEGTHRAPDCSSPSSCGCEGAGGSGDTLGLSATSPESSASSVGGTGVLALPDPWPRRGAPPGSRLSVEVAEVALVGDVTRCPGAPGLAAWAGCPTASRGRSGRHVGMVGLGGRGKPSGCSMSPAAAPSRDRAPVGPSAPARGTVEGICVLVTVSGSMGWLGSRPPPGLSADAMGSLPGAAPCSSSAKGKENGGETLTPEPAHPRGHGRWHRLPALQVVLQRAQPGGNASTEIHREMEAAPSPHNVVPTKAASQSELRLGRCQAQPHTRFPAAGATCSPSPLRPVSSPSGRQHPPPALCN